jgi:hypothetical protein
MTLLWVSIFLYFGGLIFTISCGISDRKLEYKRTGARAILFSPIWPILLFYICLDLLGLELKELIITVPSWPRNFKQLVKEAFEKEE